MSDVINVVTGLLLWR